MASLPSLTALRSMRSVRCLAPPLKRRRLGTSAPPETILAPYVEAFLALPHHLPAIGGQPVSYAACIGLLAIALRGTISLPITMWARNRGDRLQDIVQPELQSFQDKALAQAEAKVKASSTKLAATEQQRYFLSLISTKRVQLLRQHKCGPWTTVFVQLILQGSIFVATSMMLRYAIRWPDPRSTQPEVPTVSQDVVAETFTPSNPLTDVSADILGNLSLLAGSSTAISRESWAWCPSLAAADPTSMLPIAVGLISLCVVEVSNAGRRNLRSAVEEARPAKLRAADQVGKFGSSTDIAVRLLTGVQRIFSVGFLIYALSNPTAVCLYWFSSFSMTLIQSLYFARLDTRKAAGIRAATQRSLSKRPPGI